MTSSRPVHIIGTGVTDLRREQDRSDESMGLDAVRAALVDAGIDAGQVTGINVQSHHAPGPDVAMITRELGVDNVDWAPVGGIGVPALGNAVDAINRGRTDVVVVCKVMNTATALNQPSVDPDTRLVAGRDQYELPYGVGYTVQRAALVHRRWTSLRGIKPEQLGTLCSVQREHALLNDRAIFTKPLTVDDYMSSRMICDPIRLFDCDMPVNGAHAYVLTADPALAIPGKAVKVVGLTDGKADDMPHIRDEGEPGIRPDVEALYHRAGITAQDLSAFMLYDGFSYIAAQWLERLGVVRPEDVGEFIGDPANLRFDGVAPLNTHGGQLSEGRMHGAGHILEAVRQLRGEASGRQIPHPQHAVVTTAFPSTGAVAILEATR